ncbi:unnamed protein product [Trichogramma brassicae]|uniref:Uncharacterized protein n=1 Tax=Trichogramma brassicae TaxID=86971 RepID=A0A6H5IHP8_9HYME|nr:unnamed protein product [Trichogramma brassicae]
MYAYRCGSTRLGGADLAAGRAAGAVAHSPGPTSSLLAGPAHGHLARAQARRPVQAAAGRQPAQQHEAVEARDPGRHRQVAALGEADHDVHDHGWRRRRRWWWSVGRVRQETRELGGQRHQEQRGQQQVHQKGLGLQRLQERSGQVVGQEGGQVAAAAGAHGHIAHEERCAPGNRAATPGAIRARARDRAGTRSTARLPARRRRLRQIHSREEEEEEEAAAIRGSTSAGITGGASRSSRSICSTIRAASVVQLPSIIATTSGRAPPVPTVRPVTQSGIRYAQASTLYYILVLLVRRWLTNTLMQRTSRGATQPAGAIEQLRRQGHDVLAHHGHGDDEHVRGQHQPLRVPEAPSEPRAAGADADDRHVERHAAHGVAGRRLEEPTPARHHAVPGLVAAGIAQCRGDPVASGPGGTPRLHDPVLLQEQQGDVAEQAATDATGDGDRRVPAAARAPRLAAHSVAGPGRRRRQEGAQGLAQSGLGLLLEAARLAQPPESRSQRRGQARPQPLQIAQRQTQKTIDLDGGPLAEVHLTLIFSLVLKFTK